MLKKVFLCYSSPILIWPICDLCPCTFVYVIIVRNTFGLRWMDAMHFDYMRCLDEVHMWQWGLGDRIYGLVATRLASCSSTQGIGICCVRSAFVGTWKNAVHALSFVTIMNASYTLSIPSSFVGHSSCISGISLKKLTWGRKFERIWTLSNFEKENSVQGI